MRTIKTDRGFKIIEHPTYPGNDPDRLVQESAAVGGYDDSADRPGSSFLYVGAEHHLDRGQIALLITALQHWLDHKCLPDLPQEATSAPGDVQKEREADDAETH